eukprot:1074306_1
MGKRSIISLLMLFMLLVAPCISYNDWYDAYEESPESQSNEKDIGIAKFRYHSNSDSDSDEVLDEFTLAAGSHINLRLWQFIVWQIGFVIVGMCLCGCSIAIYSKCCG